MTKDPKIPENHHTVMPYIIVKNASGFITFTEKVFGAIKTYTAMRDENTIMHAEVMIGDSPIMFADATDKYMPNTAALFIYVTNADEVYKKAIEAGSTIVTEMADQTYGRSGGVTDPFGNTWWITGLK